MAERKKVREDCVEYRIFPAVSGHNDHQTLLNTLDTCLAVVSPHVVDYIWHIDPFQLTPVDGTKDCPPHLFGKTTFGDNIEDEWLIVYLLFELSRQIPELVIQVQDIDGEFLLIEAADALPKWVDPETVENRVFLYNNELHIIPRPQTPAEVTIFPASTPTLQEAVNCVRQSALKTRASPQVQKALKARVNEYPEKIQENIHHTHCYIPANLAAALERKPDLVAAGVQAFYQRDPIDLQACRTMQYFRPGTRVTSRVKMTRCLYAQLMQQKFQPDKRCGFTLPSSSNPKFTSHDLGMKLAHGFEILCSKCDENEERSQNGHQVRPNDVRWKRYLQSLKEKGFFRGEIEGSKKYNELLSKAREFYQQQSFSAQSRWTAGDVMLDLLDKVTFDIDAMRRNEARLPPPDDDSWLDISPEELDALLMKRSGARNGNSTSPDLGKVASSMKTFVDQISSVDGVEFPGEGEDEGIQFDSTGFISAMTKMFEFEDNNDGESSSDMEEYGWDDSDIDVDDQPPVVQTEKRKQSVKSSGGLTVQDYMDLMDQELGQTSVGKSFEKEPQVSEPTSTKPQNESKKKSKKSIAEEDDDFEPVNIDINIVKNMLESMNAQPGLAGPASNILQTMGVKIPTETKEPPKRPPQPMRRSSGPEERPSVPPKPTNLPVSQAKQRPQRPPPPKTRTIHRQQSKETNV
ncbi:protein ecdysoneless homolog [Saccostrea echinata]|uniref:protein ecdysoneless homolog n=1 Tax=Saccostrea echinata TaxID=191078 RepID=UPI002A7F6C85|nr:protein ecdysoneless homolog [Saccostrea echinata]